MRRPGPQVHLVLMIALSCPVWAQDTTPLDQPRPIEAGNSLWAEELTWMEIRDAVHAGTTTIIIGTGGIEQNGPYVAVGKHNYVLETVLPYIARSIGNALIAPIVKFVPEGQFDPHEPAHQGGSVHAAWHRPVAYQRNDRARQETLGVPRGDHGQGL